MSLLALLTESGKSSVPASGVLIANHRFNAIASIVEDTDTDWYYRDTNANPDLFLMKYNIKGTVFACDDATYREDKEDWGILQTFGRISYGAAYYLGNDRGFSEAQATIIKNFIAARVGKTPSVCSYGNGDDSGAANLKTSFLGGRNSDEQYPSDGVSKYGINNSVWLGIPETEVTHDTSISRENTARWRVVQLAEGRPTANAYTTDQIDKTIANLGYFNNFNHWHNLEPGDTDGYFSLVSGAIGSTFVCKCGYDEALEYLWFRKMIDSISLEDNGGNLTITITHSNPYTDIDTTLLQTPISVVLNTAGSSVSGSEISCAQASGIRKEATNRFVIDVDYSASPITLTINTTGSPSYYDFTLPIITNIAETSGVVTFTTNIECRAVLYLGTRGGEEEDTRILYRDTTLNTEHSIDFNVANNRDYYETTALNDILNGDVYIGVISEMGESVLSTVQQFQ